MVITQEHRKGSQKPVIVLVGVAIWFGFQAWVMQSAVRASSPLTFNAERFGVAFVLMALLCLICRQQLTGRALRGGLILGGIAACSFACESFSVRYDPAGRASFLGSLYVIALPLGAWLLLRKRQSMLTVLGCGLVLIGAFMLLYTPGGTLLGDRFALIRAGLFALLISANRHFGSEDFRFMTLIQFGIVCLFSTTGAIATNQAPFSFSWEVFGPALACGIGGSAMGVALELWAQARLPMATVGVLSFSEAPMTVLWGLLLGKQTLAVTALAAFGLIALGTVTVISGDHRKRQGVPFETPRLNASSHLSDIVSPH